MEAEAFRATLRFPVLPGGLQHVEGAGDVRLDEDARAVDGPVDVAFGREMHDGVGRVTVEDSLYRSGIADVRLLERRRRGCW